MAHVIWKGAVSFGLVYVPLALHSATQADVDCAVLSDAKIKTTGPKTIQTIETEPFMQAGETDFTLLKKPYSLEPIVNGETVHALLCEARLAAGAIGMARVFMHTKEHLAALIPP